MKNKISYFLVATIVCFCHSANADFILTAGNSVLQANQANQAIPIFATFQSSVAHSIATTGGIQLNVRLGDGSGSPGTPVFQGANVQNSQLGISFAGTIWDGNTVDISGSAPVDLNPLVNGGAADIATQYGSMGISFVSNADFRTLTSSPQQIASLIIDTTGVNSGTYAITLDDIVLGKTYFQSATDVDLTANTFVINGTFSIAAVPEPSTVLLIGCASVVAMMLRRRRTIA